MPSRTHGHTSGKRGVQRPSPTYRSYSNAKTRCYNPKSIRYEEYGGRGIKFCDQWLGEGGFERFLADMGERPPGTTIERKDTNGDYSPENCVWATPLEQASNKRNNILVEHDGNMVSLRRYAALTGVSYQPLYVRVVYRGQDPERAKDAMLAARWVEHEGRLLKLAEFARAVGVNYKNLHSTMKRHGLTPYEAAALITHRGK